MRTSLFNTILLSVLLVVMVALNMNTENQIRNVEKKIQVLELKIEQNQRLILQSVEIKER